MHKYIHELIHRNIFKTVKTLNTTKPTTINNNNIVLIEIVTTQQ